MSPDTGRRAPAGPEKIRKLYLTLTAQCNLRCGYCFQNTKQARKMSWDTLQASLDLALASHQDSIELVFFGGEPLLEAELIRRAVGYCERQRAPDRRVEYGLITNGTLLDVETAEFLASHRFKIQLSFDGVPSAQDARGEGTFQTLDALLDRLSANHWEFFLENLTVAVTLTCFSAPHLADSVDYFLAKGVQNIFVSPSFTHEPGWQKESIVDLEDQFIRIYQSSMLHYRKTGRIPVTILRPESDESKGRSEERAMCGVMLGETPTVDVDGEVVGCATFADSYQSFPSPFLRDRLGEARMGHLADPGFRQRYAQFPEKIRRAEIFHDKRRKYSSYRKCAECEYLSGCSVCPVSIGHIPGNEDPHRVPDLQCAFNLVSLKYRDLFVERLPALIPVQDLREFAQMWQR